MVPFVTPLVEKYLIGIKHGPQVHDKRKQKAETKNKIKQILQKDLTLEIHTSFERQPNHQEFQS